jgi:hypothetical protein
VTNPDVGPFTFTYVVSAVGFTAAFLSICIAGAKLLDDWANRHIQQHVERALFDFDAIEDYANGEAHR